MGMKIKIKRWIVTLTLLFLGVFLPLRSQPQSRIPVDTGEVNPSNPPRFKGFRASPSSIIQFYFSEAGKRFCEITSRRLVPGWVAHAAQSLSGESLPLKAEVQRFLDGVRAA